ncbi:TRAP transporter large permease [Sedimentitalea sp.]|uniref:TRAP transporter large permease n=1 Tax=Sedimentitalea sp. TaxID=2048915 RepID=UPI003296CFCF
MIALTIFLLLLVLLAAGAPVGIAMIIAGSIGLYWIAGPNAVYGILASTPHDVAATFEFSVIPMFLLMAAFVMRSGIAEDLFRAAAAWCGRVPGGLGMATALSGAGFGAICGSSTAAAVTLSSTSLPAMMKHGYNPRMAAGVVSISGTLSMLIPPSIAMVIYGLLADVNIAKLLIAGIVPAIFVTCTIMATTYVLAKRNPSHAPLAERVTLREKFRLLTKVGPIVLLFLSVTGVIYSGIATPTEASSVGALIAGLLYFLRARRTPSEVYDVLVSTARASCMIGVILLGAHVFSTFFALTQVTQGLITWIGSLDIPPWSIVIVLALIYLALGCFMDQLAILVLTVPIVAPLIDSLGYDLIWWGVVMIIVAEVGLVTPPLGLNCFIVAKYSSTPLAQVFSGTFPHVLAHLIVIAVLLLFPAITLWLPNQMQ